MAVKPKYIKDLGRKIYKQYSEDVTTNFDRNKQIVKQSTNVESIEIRNRVAGYLCSLKERNNTEEED